MSKWLKTPKRYGGTEDNRKMAAQYGTWSKDTKKRDKMVNIKKFCKVIGYIVFGMSCIAIGMSIFMPAVKCLFPAILALLISMAMLCSTERIY